MGSHDLTVIRLPAGRRTRRELAREEWERDMERRMSLLEGELLDPMALLRRLHALLNSEP